MYKKTKNLHHYRQFVLDSLTSDFFWNNRLNGRDKVLLLPLGRLVCSVF